MNVADYIVDFLIKKEVTDVFGIPGGVVLDFLYAIDRKKEISAHLCCHEQAAAFAAVGYAQVNNKLGVAYSTRGPGFTNMITAIAEAYYDSIPVFFITGHSVDEQNKKMRIEYDQELEISSIVKNISKYNININSADEIPTELEKAYKIAMTGRPGPVILNISSKIWLQQIENYKVNNNEMPQLFSSAFEPYACSIEDEQQDYSYILQEIISELNIAKRPVILIGDGVNQSGTKKYLKSFIEKTRIPVVSSRGASDILADSPSYYGYIGSHGIREANFIISKADLIISLGNRLSYPVNSKSFSQISAKIIRIDIDEAEFERQIPNCINFKAHLKIFMPQLEKQNVKYRTYNSWSDICDNLKNQLMNQDNNIIVKKIKQILDNLNNNNVIVSDVGNNEFFLSKACTLSKVPNRVLYSKSFGTLGCALPKSIGAYYATKQNVICFTGDQGFQFNIQDMQTIAVNKLPILCIIINNKSSGMILDREKMTNKPKYLHTTYNDGYSNPDFGGLAKGWKVNYYNKLQDKYLLPAILELSFDEIIHLEPFLEKGEPCQNLSPKIDKNLYCDLNNL